MNIPEYVKEKLSDLPIESPRGMVLFVLEIESWYFFDGKDWQRSIDYSFGELENFTLDNSGMLSHIQYDKNMFPVKINNEIKRFHNEFIKIMKDLNLGLRTIQSQINSLHNLTNHTWILCTFNNNSLFDNSGNYKDIIFKNVSFDNSIPRNNGYNSSLYFNGNSFIQFDGFTFNNEFTFEFWLTNNSQSGIIGLINSNNVTYQQYSNLDVNIYQGNLIVEHIYSGFHSNANIFNLPEKKWFHIAFCLKNEKLSLYINGKLDTESSYATLISTGTKITFGSGFKGHLSDLKISDICLYSEEFIPPLSFE